MTEKFSHSLWAVAARSLCLSLAAATSLCLGAAHAAELAGIRFGAYKKDVTRVVFDLTGPVDYTISGDAEGNGRIFIEFKGLSATGSAGAGKGRVARFRVDPTDADGVTAATLELSKFAKIEKSFLLAPQDGVAKNRLVIDLASGDKASFLASLPPRYEDMTPILQAVTAPTAAAEEGAPAPRERPVVVIDAGHGGGDPGAAGPGGDLEKDVTLAAAKELKKLLEAEGRYRIVMTRADDTRISLDERSQIARDAGAKLFISLHADAHPDKNLRGASVYTLSKEGTERSAREAQSQGDYQIYNVDINKVSDPVVGGILFDLAQQSTKTESMTFADFLVQSLNGVIPLLNNSHRTGDLYVLLSPDVPAVLLEMAFISNKGDEAHLASPAWREQAMGAVATAIDRYFDARQETQHASNLAARTR
ncbi:MAG TPA: N-acetylmuramoyl-L-alanine amidase [Parvularculaceae bacterium]|nr:N-acetylmuramoyl-L-alanine amidase [Parvularculaceae bacterium]